MLQCNECVTALSIKLGVISDLITLVILATIVSSYDKVSANTASSVPKCYKKLDGSQDARRGSPDMPNQPLEQ